MEHRIREAMKPASKTTFGTGGGTVEMDETYIGLKEGRVKPRSGSGHKLAVVAHVERGGPVRSFYMPQLRGSDMRTNMSA